MGSGECATTTMALEDRLQGEWLCCMDEQCLEEAWLVEIRGKRCDFEGAVGQLQFSDEEAVLDLGDGDRLVINRRWERVPVASDADIPVVIEGARGILQSGWMFRPTAG